MFKWPKSEPSISAVPATPVKGPALVPQLASVDSLAVVQAEPIQSEPIQVEHSDDLPVFSRKLYDVIALMPSLKHRVCPIDVSTQEDRKQFAVILLQSELNTDLTGKVVEEFTSRGWTLASNDYYIASPSVMDELARDAINNHTAGKGGTAKKHDSALWNLFESAASFALTNGASDIHIRINRSREHSQIRFRIDGRLTRPREFEMPTLRLLDMVAYIYNIHSNAGSENVFNENAPQQCQVFATIKGTKVLFRWASMKTGRGTKVVMRVIVQDTENPKTLNELGYLDPQIKVWERAITRLGGGILVGGVVNSGKSTTLQTVMSMMPNWMAKISVEDPIENFIADTDQFSVSRALSDGETDPFIAVKRQTKRMDPDVVMIAEIRDRESAGLFCNGACAVRNRHDHAASRLDRVGHSARRHRNSKLPEPAGLPGTRAEALPLL
jgi:type II secretory ATPase GspE/PulE/Tfp pilus assembly ATPase PilB-like protein